MSLQNIKDFFKAKSLWEQVAAGLILSIILGIWGLWWYLKPKSEPPVVVIEQGPNSISQTVVGDNVNQVLKIDKSRSPSGGVYIEKVESGATVNINVIDYQDGVSKAEKSEVRELFQKARTNYITKEFNEAIEDFARCLDLEEDSEKRGALNLQIGNCYYEQQLYLKAAEFYAAGLRESRKAKDLQGEASNLASIANTYILRPASSGEVRGDNIRKAVERYGSALKIFNKDEYQVDYAKTQNNLGSAYTDLPSATAEQRAENVRKAIECYKAALEIYKKDEHPQYYCLPAANLGLALASINNPDACYWLKEAYALREYLGDQGKRLEEVIRRICKEERK